MTIRIFNTEFEVGLRIIILLSEVEEPVDFEFIVLVDFLATYGKDFGIADANMNGGGQFKFSEFPARNPKFESTLKSLVLDGMLHPFATNAGMMYELSEQGKLSRALLDSAYADRYTKACISAIEYIQAASVDEITGSIYALSNNRLQGGRQ